MNDFTPPTLNKTDDRIQWKSPVFIISILVALVVIGSGTVLFLTRRATPLGERVDGGSITKTYIIGTPVNQEKAATSVNELINPGPENNLLVTSTLRTTYSGFLASIQELAASNATDPALAIELTTKGDGSETAGFQLTKAELENTRIYLVSPSGLTNVGISDLFSGFGISITRITDLMAAKDSPDEIIIEATQ